jgi:hypothetical protein
MNRMNRARGSALSALWPLLVLLGVAACSDLLSVEAPSRIPAKELDTPAKAALRMNGAVANFECALGSYAVMSGLIGGELSDITQTAARWVYERRVISPNDGIYASNGCASLGLYTPLSTTRWQAEDVLAALEGWSDAEVPERNAKIATAAAYAGYSHVLLGEGFCTGVLLDAELVPGGEVPRTALLERAVEKFTRAIEAARAAKNDEILNMALVGRARAYLGLGKKAEAAADARLVPPTFVKGATASMVDSRRYNRVFSQNNQSQAVTVGPAYQGYRHMGVADPRVVLTDTRELSRDGYGTPIFEQTKYVSLADSIPLATGREAQLILAEAVGGQEAVNIINALHARVGLPPFASNDPAVIQAHLIEERQSELFLEGHRLGDIIRYDLKLTPAPNDKFRKGGSYGPEGKNLCLPLPNVERLNNPKIGQ